jgi:O-antigen ligase
VRRPSSIAQIVLLSIIPLYGTMVALDPSKPPIPRLVPDWIAAAVGIALIGSLIATIPAAIRSARRDMLTAALLAPGIAMLLAAITGFDPVFSIGLGVLVLGGGAAAVGRARDTDAPTARACVRAFLASGTASGLLALAMVVLRRPAAIYAYDNGRAVGTFINPNELAVYTLFGLGIAVPLAIASRGRDRLAIVAAIVFALTLGATFSRWGVFSAVCGVAAYALFTRARVLLVAAVALAVAGLALNAVAGAQHHNPRDTEARMVAWQAGLTTFARFPLLGVGPIAFGRTYDELRPPDAPGPRTPVAFDPHSLPISFAADGGILAVVTLTASLAIVVRRIVVGAGRTSSLLSRALAFGIAAATVALVVDSAINTIILFFAMALQVVPLGLAVSRTDAL